MRQVLTLNDVAMLGSGNLRIATQIEGAMSGALMIDKFAGMRERLTAPVSKADA